VRAASILVGGGLCVWPRRVGFGATKHGKVEGGSARLGRAGAASGKLTQRELVFLEPPGVSPPVCSCC
jgi:hypothetical protein